MKSRIVAVVLVLALALSAGVVLAQRGKQPVKPAGPPAMAPAASGGWCMGMGMLGRLKAALNLSAEQMTQLEAIQKDFLDSTQGLRTDIQAKMKQMLDLWMADQPDAAAIKDLANQLDALRAQIRDSAIDHAIQAIGVLTPDQRAKLRDMMSKSPGMCMGMGCGLCCGAGLCGPGMGCPIGGPGVGRGQGGPGRGMGPGGGGANCPFAR